MTRKTDRALTYDMIRCTDNQWDNLTMRALAMHHFRAHPDCEFVLVYEHGGWHLGFRRDGTTWCTANDLAQLKPGPRPREFSGLACEYPDIPTVRPHHIDTDELPEQVLRDAFPNLNAYRRWRAEFPARPPSDHQKSHLNASPTPVS